MTESVKSRPLHQSILLQVAPFSAVVLLLLTVYAGVSVRSGLLQENERRIQSAAEHTASLVDSKIRLVVDACEAQAINDVMVNGVVDSEYRNTITRPFMQSLKLPGGRRQSITMTDYRGRPLLSSERRPVLPDTAWIETVMSGRRLVAVC